MRRSTTCNLYQLQTDDAPPTVCKDGKVLGVEGSQDTIFDAETVVGKQVVASNALIYDPENYTPLK